MRNALCGLLGALFIAVSPLAAAEEGAAVVFAAASLQNALDAAAADYRQATGKEVTISYAASSALAKQIEEGAPADIFFSADLAWMDYLEERDLIDVASRVTLLGNTLVLVAPADSSLTLDIGPGFPLAEAVGDGRLAIAETTSVPAGKYGRWALESRGVWESVADRLAETENVRAALALVSRGEAPLGIVYATDARADPGVKVVATFPEDTHPPILYPVALTMTADAEALAFFDFLASSDAQAAFQAAGFRFSPAGF
jgi:molybdate transport system substrate-binding protein